MLRALPFARLQGGPPHALRTLRHTLTLSRAALSARVASWTVCGGSAVALAIVCLPGPFRRSHDHAPG